MLEFCAERVEKFMCQKRRLFHDKIFQDFRMCRRCRTDDHCKQHQTCRRQNGSQLGIHCKKQGNCTDHRQKAEKVQQVQFKQFPELSAEYLKKTEYSFFLGGILRDTGTGTLIMISE